MANSHNPADATRLHADAGLPEPVAVIGAACRFSGTASSQDGLWQLLSRGSTTWASSARGRFKLESFWHPNAQLSGSTNSKGLHLLQQNPAVFDNDFFGISGLEAKAIDPNQRLLLEVAYEAFENAGLSLQSLEGSQTGVICAVPYLDYDHIQGRDPEVSPIYRFTGTGPSILANRISYVFDLKGPSMVVDTACSSTLVAIHEACRTLRAGDADQILVGGSNLILDPDKLTNISSMQFLSPHGRCYPFDSRASGYGRGEAIAAVLLKPLSSAIRDGDNIRAVIRGSATGSDGRTQGITLPSPTAQYSVIRKAYKSAGLDPKETPFVEAHGTGTIAGDGAEIQAFAEAFCEDRSGNLLVGSVKANLGHTEGVAGLASLIKSILMLENGLIVPNPDFRKANANLDLEGRKIEVPTKMLPWPADMARRVSINATGYGGVNAHIIVDAWPGTKQVNGRGTRAVSHDHEPAKCNGTTRPTKPKSQVFVWSHQREDGLVKMVSGWKRFVMALQAGAQDFPLEEMAFTLGTRRSHLSHRVSILASGVQELLDGIRKIGLGSIRPTKAAARTTLCFVFTGQGAQWARMGVELMASYDVFSSSLRTSEARLLGHGAIWRLVEELEKPEQDSRINHAELAQPCCTAIQIALVDLLASWGVRPDQVCGHSSGEIAAAYAAGALTADDAITVAYFRGQAAKALREMAPDIQGGMLAVGLSESDVLGYLGDLADTVAVACVNSPSSVTLSGDSTAMDRLKTVFDSAGVFNRRLAVDVAYHSHHMAMVEEYYFDKIRSLSPHSINPRVRMVSSVTGRELQGPELDAAYWTRNLVSTVRFSEALTGLVRLKDRDLTSARQSYFFLEIGPNAALRGPSNQVLKSLTISQPTYYTSCLQRKRNPELACLLLAQELFEHGLPVDLNTVNNPHKTPRRVLPNLPSYNWHHENVHWNESRRSAAYRSRKFPRHELLGNPSIDGIGAEPCWRAYFKLSEMPWIRGHCINGQVVFAASGFVCMIMEALKRHCLMTSKPWQRRLVHFKEIVLDRPLFIPKHDHGAEVFTVLRPYTNSLRKLSSKWLEFRIFSASETNESTEHCRGLVSMSDSTTKLATSSQASDVSNDGPADQWVELDGPQIFKNLRSVGNEYSGCFASLARASVRAWETKCEMIVPDVRSIMPSQYQQAHCLHPTTLEACVQACLPGLQAADCSDGAFVVAGIDEVFVSTDTDYKPGERLLIQTRTAPYGRQVHTGDFVVQRSGEELAQADQEAVIAVKGIRYVSMGADGEDAAEGPLCHQIDWVIDPVTSSATLVSKYCREGLFDDGLPRPLRTQYDAFCRGVIKHTLEELTPEVKEAATGDLRLFLDWMSSHSAQDARPLDAGFKEEMLGLGASGETLVKYGQTLTSTLRGDAQASRQPYESLLAEDECTRRCVLQLVKYLTLLMLKAPSIRILDFGGGSGINVRLLEGLLGIQQDHPSINWTYVFAGTENCLPAGLQGTMMERLKSSVEFKRLDTGKCPSNQGFELSSFDVIVTSNAVHQTADQLQTMRNLRGLLKPGGHIAMIELTEPSLRWGLLGGGSSGLLSASQWDQLLSQSGFSGVCVELKDFEAAERHEASLLISRAADTASPNKAEGIVIIADDSSSGMATDLRDGLQGQNSDLGITIQTLSDATGSTAAVCIVLMETSSDLLVSCSASEWSCLRETLHRAQTVIWVTKGAALSGPEPQRGLAAGLGRALRLERPGLNFCTLDLDPACHDSKDAVSCIIRVYEQHVGPKGSTPSSKDWDYAVRGGFVLVPRVVENKAVNDWVEDAFSKDHIREVSLDTSRSLGLHVRSSGKLDTLYWADVPAQSQPPGPSQIKVLSDRISLNFKDVMIAMGQLDGQSTLLIEGSGTVLEVGDPLRSGFSVGDKVCFFAPDGLATVCNIDVDLASPVPAGMDMDTAASLPVAYATALFALRDAGRVEAGESVLIHSGAGAVGQAAISIAQHLGVKDIFVTAGSDERRSFVRDRFGIPSTHILSSRDADFGDEILRLTDGRGVDLVVNSLSGDMLAASLGTLAPFGRFVELGKKDILTNGRLEMKYLENNITVSVVDLTQIAKKRPAVYRKLLRSCVELVREGHTRAIGPISSTHIADAEKQFRALQTGNHIGKSIFRADSSRPIKVQPPKPKAAELRRDGSYLVVGSSRRIDNDVIKYLASLGAKRILFLSRLDVEDHDMQRLVREVDALGSELLVLRGSIGDKWALGKLKAANGEMPIRGVIQGVAPHHAVLMEFTTHLSWRQNSIGRGTLDLLAHFGNDLDFYILLGSAAGVIGADGHGMHAANSAFQDAFARYAASLGRPVRAIDTGLIEGEAASFESGDLLTSLGRQGLRPRSKAELLSVLNYAMQNPVAATPAQAQILCGDMGSSADARFAFFEPPGKTPTTQAHGAGDLDVPAALRAAARKEEAVDAALRGMRHQLTQLLAVPAREIHADRSVASYGVDSLISVELKNWVASCLKSHVQTIELMSPMEMVQLAELLAQRSRLVPAGVFGDAR